MWDKHVAIISAMRDVNNYTGYCRDAFPYMNCAKGEETPASFGSFYGHSLLSSIFQALPTF